MGKKYIKSLVPGWLVRYRGSPKRPVVAITFDDGPRLGITDRLVTLLAERRHAATFFAIGREAERHPEILESILRSGSELGNHLFTHCRLRETPYRRVIGEIERTDEILKKITGAEPAWFRPPCGDLTLRVCFYLWRRSRRKQPVLWSVYIPHEHLENSTGALKILEEAQIAPGDIVLLHDDNPEVVSVLCGLLDMLEARGLRSVTLTNLFDSAY